MRLTENENIYSFSLKHIRIALRVTIYHLYLIEGKLQKKTLFNLPIE